MNRNPFVDFAKGILILLVVIGHALQYAVDHDTGSWMHPLYQAIYLFHMPLFMAISGYLSFSGIQKARLLPFMANKATSYLIPILAWAGLFCLVTGEANSLSPLHILANTGHEVIGTRFWFLWALLGSLGLTVIVRTVGRNHFLPLYLLSTLAVLLMPEKGIVYLFKYTYLFFQAGYLVAGHGMPSFVRRHAGWTLAITGALTAVGWHFWTDQSYVYLSQMSLGHGNWQTVLFRYGVNIVATIFAGIILFKVYGKMPQRWSSLLVSWGKNSIYIYMLQGYTFEALMNMAIALRLPIPGQALASVLAVALGIVVTSFCWYVGVILSRSTLAGRVFFGKIPRPQLAAVPVAAGS